MFKRSLQKDFYDLFRTLGLSHLLSEYVTQKVFDIVVVHLTAREAEMANFMVNLGIKEAEVTKLQEELLEQQRIITNLISMYNDVVQITRESGFREDDFKALEAANKKI